MTLRIDEDRSQLVHLPLEFMQIAQLRDTAFAAQYRRKREQQLIREIFEQHGY